AGNPYRAPEGPGTAGGERRDGLIHGCPLDWLARSPTTGGARPHRRAIAGQNEGLTLLTQRQREAKSSPVSKQFQGYPTVAKAELGTKRVCPVTGRKFYDLNKDPVISPYTGEIV